MQEGEGGAASVQPVYCSPPKKSSSLQWGNSAKKTFTGEILCQLKETGIPLALDAKNMQANTEASSLALLSATVIQSSSKISYGPLMLL